MRIFWYIWIFLLCVNAFAGERFQFPGPQWLWYSYNDSSSGGVSEIVETTIADSSIQWIFELSREEYPWPYVGLSRTIESHESSGYNREDSLVIHMSSNREGRVVLKLSTFDPNLTKPGDPLTYRILEKPVTITTGRRRIAAALSEFRVAEWWKQQNGVAPEDNALLLDSLCLIDVIVNDPHRFGHTDTIKIFALDFISPKDGTPGRIAWFFSFLLFASLLTFTLWRKREVSAVSLTLAPQKVSAAPSDWERVIAYMQKCYRERDLNIRNVASELGFSESKLSHLIGEHFTGGFRAFIHEMRITEAKRLLQESEMNITEIAYSLGYATPSHFNREFKKRTEVSPSKFRTVSE